MADTTNDAMIFDDVFRTMITKMPTFLIPLINDVFHTTYSLDTPVHHDMDTHITLLGKRTTDSCLHVGEQYQYHFECQSHPDGSIVVRFFEYDVAIALQSIQQQDGYFCMKFPRSAVLYLRHTKNTPSTETMFLEFADGTTHSYTIPIIKLKEYSLDAIFEKKLFILLPFYLLRYEKWLKKLEEYPDVQETILMDYRRIHAWLTQEPHTSEQITYNDIRQLIMRIVEYLLKDLTSVKERIGDTMGGKVLELFSEQMEREKKEQIEQALAEALPRAIAEGIAQGKAQGMAQGMAQGRDEGIYQYQENLITKKIKNGKSLEQIAAEMESTVEEIRELYTKIQEKLITEQY